MLGFHLGSLGLEVDVIKRLHLRAIMSRRAFRAYYGY